MDRESAEALTEAAQLNVESIRRIGVVGYREKVHVALGLSNFEEWAGRTFAGIKIAKGERREIVQEMAAEGATQREIAALTGAALGTVNGDMHAGDEPLFKTEQDAASAAEDYCPSDEPLFKTEQDAQSVEDPADEAEPKSTRDLLAQSDENEWYTPRRFIEAAIEVLDRIDLDPASSATANAIVGAAQFYTIDDDGLTKPWKGTVWLNPPYGGQNRPFIEHLIREYEAGNVSAAVALVNCHPAETAWFQRLFGYTVCFVRGRIDFSGPARERASTSTHGSAVAYLGPDWKQFATTFQRFGSVVRRV